MREHGRVCPWWMAYTFDNPFRRLWHNPAKLFGAYLRPDMTVVDIGCGMGFFSIGIAGMLSDAGQVIAVDLQQKMLDVLMKRAARKGVTHRIRPHRCEADTLMLDAEADFILAFWSIHEMPDADHAFGEIRACLKPEGKLLFAEPAMHIRRRRYERTVEAAIGAGFQPRAEPHIMLSHATLFQPVDSP